MNALDLKNSILQLAIQGKLVEQIEGEGTAKELIKKIKAEKEQLINEGKIRKEKPFPKIEEDEIPFDVPDNWEWVRFGDLGSYKKGPFGSALTKSMFVPKGTDTVKVYEQKNAIQKSVNLGDYYITREYFESKMKGFELLPGDIIVSCAGTIGETYVMPPDFEQGIINQALMQMKLMPSIYVEYFLLYFDFILKKTARKSSKGSAIKNIPPFKELKNYVVPLPPLEEQKRIVAKIEELMPYIEKYDKAYSEVEELNKKFPEDMQKSILQYAIKGKLAEQRVEEGTAEELYQQIQTEKEKLVKEGKIKKQKKLPEITEDEIPFDIPENWKWVRLADVSENIHYGYTASANEVGNCKLLRITDIQNNSVEWESVPFCDVKDKDYVTYGLNNRDIMIARTGGTIGKTYIVESLNDRAVFASYLIRVVPVNNINEKYLKKFMESPLYWHQLKEGSMGTGQPNVNGTTLSKLVLPLPPLAEQERIVEEIEQLLPYTKQLVK
ncbi:restriction endonuclease subunit S [Bacillus pumilus]|uniref:restriction endonuclease subunit S n=1 Tax=Bacillus pumilus TaxID=1408 RepID=UPI003CF87D59